MTDDDFRQWLDRYGDAWREGDPDAAAELFCAGAAYHETPFDAPMIGTAAIHRYWTDGAKNAQTAVSFEAMPILLKKNTGFAHWRATFRRVPSNAYVELDGVLSARFDSAMRCEEFREWWHRKETQAGSGDPTRTP
ncbi:MAG: hypothetical protein A3G25_07485 [Betaproteobacteria bacterium RIFCSPLOWO2_12_FULL_63_13]|nr:MAG: hypothetical protein A3H32_07205 [Betaproteobacteria bacterium RIFCSPLOWO2_02_FULL_63_19]OGA43205.1 MAG: hypothetical protein A3G25_07485 [Betaproteobacteria bacterium RIFCSPLOWO2_12_FULL_63_13]